jgi:hypothetical protein
VKFVLSTKNTGLHEPPSLHIETFVPATHSITSEAELVQYIFRQHGSGDYIIHAPIGPNKTFKTLWEGEIEIEDDRNLMFKASQNQLLTLSDLSVTPPATSSLKRVPIPRDLRDAARNAVQHDR